MFILNLSNMTVAKFMTQPDTVNDIGTLVSTSFKELGKAGTKTFNVLKFILYDVTMMLQKLPFGNWVSIVYFIFMSTAIKNVVEGGELNRVLARAIQLYFIQQKSYSECISRLQSYLWRFTLSQIHEVQSFAYGVMVYAWDYTGGSVKREVKRFAKEVVLNNADDIEKTVKEIAKTAVFSAMVSAVSQKLVSELGPAAMDVFSKSDIAKSIVDIQILSSNLVKSVAIIGEANVRGELHLLENNLSLNQKLAEISMQLEYLRVNQPSQFREIMNAVSRSTLVLNDIGLPSSVVDAFAKLTGTFSYSEYQNGKRRIENV